MKTIILVSIGFILFFLSCSHTNPESVAADEEFYSLGHHGDPEDSTWNKLTKEEEYVIVHKGTERPWTGKYVDNKKDGVYTCKRCDQALFNADSKFDSGTGWPSFDDFIGSSVSIVEDADGFREEIICSNCGGHLGHVFYNEGFTRKNTRHCVNSISLSFEPKK
ncbi:methionine-R-sulfoxide reductase [Crocinitomix algicola]|uniref:methionine-R-sulfoxide reductase n=1 Tax=Crocinitomix algicola TaxID=1740263 RepID=UPI000BBA2242|nr:methionine-R-sulfoxide reductase [Crocinitomix algicola]